MSDISMNDYFSGKLLYGEDLTDDAVDRWFFIEKEDTDFGAKNCINKNNYYYHAINKFHGFNWIGNKNNLTVLAIGGAYGNELLPVINKITGIYILEASSYFKNDTINGVPKNYLKADPQGHIPLEDNTVDLVTCFWVLHHLPKITPTISEIHRVLKPGGFALIRDYTGSMGDWTKKRAGASGHERGIPLNIFRKVISESGLEIVRERKCIFSDNDKLEKSGIHPYNSNLFTRLDDIICNYVPWKYKYHPTNIFDKIRPSCVFYVLRKNEHNKSNFSISK